MPIIHFFRLIAILRVINKRGGFYLIVKKLPKVLYYPSLLFVRRNTKESNGVILRSIFYELGAIFIKLGQAVSTRFDLIGEEAAKELSLLQDKIPVSQDDYIDASIERNFGISIKKLFKEFDRNAVAAASIAEVFRAKTHNGKDVAVKILKPDIRKEYFKDLKFFKWLAGFMVRNFEIAKRLKPFEVVNTFENFVRSELDLTLEAAAATKFKELHKDNAHIYIPEIFWDLSSTEVLTLEWIDGIKISEIDELKKRKYDLKKISSEFVLMFFKQAFEAGFFHADLHSGNILINEKQQIVLIDFGIVGSLDINSRVYIAEILYGFMKKDYDQVAQVHFEAGYIPRDQSFFAFSQACRAIGEPIVGRSSNEISIADFFTQLLKTTRDFKMEVQPQLLLLQKTIVMSEGVAVRVYPEINLWEVTSPFIYDWSKIHLAFDAQIIRKISNVISRVEKISQNQQSKNNCSHNGNSNWLLFFILLIAIYSLIK